MFYFSCQEQKITISRRFNLLYNSWLNTRLQPLLVKSRPPAAPPSTKYTSSCREGFPLKAKFKKNFKGFHPPPPLPTLFYGEGMNLLVRARLRLQLAYSIYEFKALNYRIYSNKRPTPPHPHSPPNRKQIEYVLIRDFPEDGVFFRVFLQKPCFVTSSSFVITIYCFVAK